MAEQLRQLNETVEEIAVQTVLVDPEDIMGLGSLLEQLEKLTSASQESGLKSTTAVSQGLKDLVEKLILNDLPDPNQAAELLNQGVKVLQAQFREGQPGPSTPEEEAFWEMLRPIIGEKAPSLEEKEPSPPPEETFSVAQDLELYRDFISEGLAHLDSIELNLINLEQSPGDKETINAIFRPFHTLKGVSGFLNLKDIHRFSHGVESLLDNVRNDKLTINQKMVDFILEAVDLLKKMIFDLRANIESGQIGHAEFDLAPFFEKIEWLQQGGAESPTAHRPKEKEGDPAPPRMGELLTYKGFITPAEVQEALKVQSNQPPGKKLGEILVAEEKIKPKQVIEALRDQKKIAGEFAETTVKVDTHKLDNLVDMVGELVIAETLVQQNPILTSLNDPKLSRDFAQLKRITAEMQKISMSLRMVPIRQTFQKMIRLVRDLARKSEKQVELNMFGEETEMDRNMVEALYDPLVHMIRNSVDHGIESPSKRREAGKAEAGQLVLQAFQKGGNIVIEIEDDGQGLNRERILAKARERGLIPEDAQWSNHLIDNLIFEPGFSTAEKITEVSGRGVGMDVVKRAIEKLKGRVEVFSEDGKGCRFSIRVPLTLAIMNGIIVRIGQERYIIPTVTIRETFRPLQTDVSTIQNRGEVINVRNLLLPLVRLYGLLGVAPQRQDPWEALVVVVENEGQQRCLMVDDLVGKQEVVIKTLGEKFKDIKGVAGGAIMGDGRVGLILDINGIFELHKN